MIGARNPNASESFEEQKRIIKTVLKKKKLNNVHYGIVVYTDKGEVIAPLSGNVQTLNDLKWEKDGSRVDQGIKKAIEGFKNNSIRRIVTFINRPSNATYSELDETLLETEKKDIKLIVVAMGDVYDAGEFVKMAPKYNDRVFFDARGSDNITRESEQAANDIIKAIIQGLSINFPNNILPGVSIYN